MKLKTCYRLMAGVACGAVMLQTTGCTFESLLPTLVYYGVTLLVSSLLGVPTL